MSMNDDIIAIAASAGELKVCHELFELIAPLKLPPIVVTRHVR